MSELRFCLTVSAVVIPMLGATWAWRSEHPRASSMITTAVALLMAILAMAIPGRPAWLFIGQLAEVPVAMAIALLLAVFATAPGKDLSAGSCARLLATLTGVLVLYTSTDMAGLLLGWILSGLPLAYSSSFGRSEKRHWHASPSVALGVSIALFLLAAILLWARPSQPNLPFYLIVVAGLIRSGIFPFHSWVFSSFETGGPLQIAWLLGARTGAFVLAKLSVPAFSEPARQALPFLSDLALFTSVLMAIMAFGEKAPRRVLALVVLSQSGFIISGLESRTVDGITGALLQWLVVSISAVGLASVLRSVEARYGSMTQQPFAGIGARTPRLAVLFLLFALSLVGLPGTLGFCAEDLLFHGALEAHPILGVALPLATALLAIRLFGLFAHIFLGRIVHSVPFTSDALPRERWLLTTLAIFLIVSGLAPRYIVSSRTGPARAIADVLRDTTTARR